MEPYIPAKVYAPPEQCHPAEGGDFEPETCQFCGHRIDEDDVANLAKDREEQLRDEEGDLRYRISVGK